MANEAVVVELTGYPQGRPLRYNISGQTAIEKGTLMIISGAGTARHVESNPATTGVTSGADTMNFAGIASVENDSDDTATTGMGCWTEGVFDLTLGGQGISGGRAVCLSGSNTIRPAVAGDWISGHVIGRILESVAASGVGNVAIGMR